MLAGMLMPALRTAKEMGYQIQCLSNIKQNGSSLALYANDYNRNLPLSSYSSGNPWYSMLWKYHKKAELLSCPKDMSPSYKMQSIGSPGSWPLKIPTGLTNGLSFLFNAEVKGGNQWRKTTYYKFPSKTHYMMEGTGNYLPFGYGNLSACYPYIWILKKVTATRWHARHDKRINALLIDGHAKNYTKKTIPIDTSNFVMGTNPMRDDVKLFWRGYIY
jgi:prepilin-type processing-associated H-X9-DG protein